MLFKLDFTFTPDVLINYRNPIITLGSCFAESVAQKLIENRFTVVSNPNGILYNPISIANVFNQSSNHEDSDLIYYNDLWHSWNHHGRFSNPNKEAVLSKIHEEKSLFDNALQTEGTSIAITFGTATTYSYSGEVVANCHKLPASKFKQERLHVNDIVKRFDAILEKFKSNKFIFTVSPVRYTKYGLIENNRNKATLLIAVDELVSNHTNASYFPSYEIVNDELRDYRFFERDLIHPNQLAIDYVWERFVETFLDDETKAMLDEWKRVSSLLGHKILNENTAASERFSLKRQHALEDFEKNFFRESL
mgnify:CR=1 FL=1